MVYELMYILDDLLNYKIQLNNDNFDFCDCKISDNDRTYQIHSQKFEKGKQFLQSLTVENNLQLTE